MRQRGARTLCSVQEDVGPTATANATTTEASQTMLRGGFENLCLIAAEKG